MAPFCYNAKIMKKSAFLIVFTALIGLSVVPVLAQTREVSAPETRLESTGILPTNPFYFVKEWGRKFRGMIIADPVRKIELRVLIAEEKASELNKLRELGLEDDSFREALEDHIIELKDLKSKLDAMSAKSEDPRLEILSYKVFELMWAQGEVL